MRGQVSVTAIALRVAAVMGVLALAACDNHKNNAPAAVRIDYGVLGKPDPSQFTSFDANILTRSAEDSLALFRKNEQNPPQGTYDHPIPIDAIEEHEDYQRALFYRGAEGAPQLVTGQDWTWVRAEEKDLISTSCENAGSWAARYQLSEKDCAGVK